MRTTNDTANPNQPGTSFAYTPCPSGGRAVYGDGYLSGAVVAGDEIQNQPGTIDTDVGFKPADDMSTNPTAWKWTWHNGGTTIRTFHGYLICATP